MSKYLIIGGGVSGLGAASLLAKQGIEFLGLEKEDQLGGHFEYARQRFYRPQTRTELQEIFPEIVISQGDDKALERHKSDWKELNSGLLPSEEYYFRSPFYFIESNPVATIPESISSKFELKKAVQKIYAGEKKVVCQDGSEYSYDKLIWTGGLRQLNRLWADDKTPVLKLNAKLDDACGGIYLEWETNRRLLPTNNAVLFPFRFRDEKLRAIGQEAELGENKFSLRWILFLENELSEDHEEVAKRLKSFRRELEKDLPESVGIITQERIVFLPGISGAKPVKPKSLEPLANILVLGPEICLAAKEEPETLTNLDLCLWNVGQFARYLALGSVSPEPEEVDAPSQNPEQSEGKAIEKPADAMIERVSG